LAIIGNFSHASSTDERNYINTQSPQYNALLKSDITINMISLGAKLFIKDREESKVNPFIIASLDKYFASASLINSQNPSTDYSQTIKIFEDQNSPLFIGIGIGTEYFFNTDFSLVTSLEDKILSYEYSYRNNFNQYSYSEETYKISKSYFKLTVGFNFYF
jgi:hypothetical protein